MFKPGNNPDGWVEGMLMAENIILGRRKINSVKTAARHRKNYEKYIASIDIEYYKDLFILQRTESKIGLNRFCKINSLSAVYFRRYLEESGIEWRNL